MHPTARNIFPETVVATLQPFALFCLLAFLVLGAVPASATSLFPHYPVIEKNVRFWEKIYDTYSTSQAVVHDSQNLGIIYEVIPIFNYRLPGSAKINKPIFKNIKNKYATILKHLAKGAEAHGKEEKRIAALFGKGDRKQLLMAAASVRVQIGQKDRFLEGVIRSGAYMGQIRKILQQKGLPEDLAYLPHVESSFDIKAYSKFGASGIWQFTRSTGQQFLTINYEVDERQDPILASHAAASFLKKNYDSLQSWPLAITAYNYGPAGMRRAQKAHGTYEKIFRHYDQGYFKFASRNFYSEFLAAVKVAKKLEKDPSITLNRPQKTLRCPLPAFMAMDDLSTHFNLSAESIKKLNPALRKTVLQGKKYIPKGYVLHLPDTRQQKALLSSIPSRFFHSKQKPTQFYRVRKGDTAGKIAKRFGVSLHSLRRANTLNKNATIVIGQKLRIPGKTPANHQPPKITPGPLRKLSRQSKKKSGTWAPSESLPLLSNNKKSKSTRQAMQSSRSVVLGELGVREVQRKNQLNRGTITILPEESVELLANWLAVTPAAIHRLNAFSSEHLLQPDERIHIPLNNVSVKEFEKKRFDFHLETEEEFFDAYKIVGVHSYTVQKGDTVWEICRKKFDLPLWLLKRYNTNLDFSGLHSSQQLTIPIVKTI